MKTYHTVRSSERHSQMSSPTFSPNHLLNKVSEILKAKNDKHLADILGIDPATISRLRHGRDYFTASTIVSILEVTDMSLKQFYRYAGIKK